MLVFLFCFGSISAQRHPIPEIHTLISSGLDRLINQDYNNAGYYFSTLNRKYPKNPLGKIFLAAREIALASDFAVPYNNAKVDQLLSEAVMLADGLLHSDSRNLWYNYYKALAEGYRAYFNAIQKNWYSALSQGLSAKGYYEKCLEMDSLFYDSYVAIGTWKYWSSEKTEFLHWLPFVTDSRDEGIRLLRSASYSEGYHSYFAVHCLFWIYINQKKFVEAKNLIEPMLKKYPASRFILWDAARVYEELDRKKAIECFKLLLDSYSKDKQDTRCNSITLNYCLAKNHFNSGNLEAAAGYINAVPDPSGYSEFEKENLGSRVERIIKLRAEIKKNIKLKTN